MRDVTSIRYFGCRGPWRCADRPPAISVLALYELEYGLVNAPEERKAVVQQKDFTMSELLTTGQAASGRGI